MTAIGRDDFRSARRERLRDLLDRSEASAVLLRRPPNFSWYTGGGDSRVDHTAGEGVADVVVTADVEYVLTSTIEAPRMREEQAPAMEVAEYPWHEGPAATLRDIARGGRVAADMPLAGGALDLGPEIARLRRVLDPDAVGRLRAVGADTAAAVAEAAAVVAAGLSEHEAAGALSLALRRRGLVGHVLLAAADDRIRRHRHPVLVGARIERRAMLVTSAERGGLYANVTRIVDLDEPDPELARRQAAVEEILHRMREEATRPGRTLADAFADCTSFYAEAGFPEEWRLHHQGGMTGYGSREVIATPASDDPIEPWQAFAWNPSIAGAKAEETFLLTPDRREVVARADDMAPDC